MKNTIPLILLTLLIFPVYGQGFKKEFYSAIAEKDTARQLQLLEKWEKADSNDPEMYVAWFNYYTQLSRKDILRLDGNGKGKESIAILDKDSSQKEPVAYMYEDSYYDKAILKKGFDYIDRGIGKHPNRLDMRFGKVYLYGQLEDFESFTAEIIKAIEYTSINKNNWTWADSKPVKDPKDFFLSTIQSYQIQLYDTGNDDLLDNMKRIAESVLKYFPDHVESLSNLSVVYLIKKDYEKALEILLKAEKLRPEDCIILGNIAQAYKLKGDKKMALSYYELMLKYGKEEDKAFATEQIKILKKN